MRIQLFNNAFFPDLIVNVRTNVINKQEKICSQISWTIFHAGQLSVQYQFFVLLNFKIHFFIHFFLLCMTSIKIVQNEDLTKSQNTNGSN